MHDESGLASQKVSFSCALKQFVVTVSKTHPCTKVAGVRVHGGVNGEEIIAVNHTANLGSWQ